MLPSFARQTVDRIRAASTDDGHGNDEPNWGDASEITLPGCSVQPGATDEVLAGRTATLIQWTVYAPPGVDVLATDRIRYQDVVYEIDGEPARWSSPTGTLDHIVLLLKTWEG